MIESSDFPRLTATNHRVMSPPTPDSNCIAWSAGDTEHWWQPGIFWPVPTPADDFGIAALEQVFKSLGYEDCSPNEQLEPGHEKVALYGSTEYYTHAARQIASGKWTSKLGKAEDIEHDTPDDVAGGVYGGVVEIMRRPIPPDR
jgi:hypothetical protein